MAKKQAEQAPKQRYVALVTIASQDGNERWVPGSLIELEDDRAAIHLQLGNVAALEGTELTPVETGPVLIVHEAEYIVTLIDSETIAARAAQKRAAAEVLVSPLSREAGT